MKSHRSFMGLSPHMFANVLMAVTVALGLSMFVIGAPPAFSFAIVATGLVALIVIQTSQRRVEAEVAVNGNTAMTDARGSSTGPNIAASTLVTLCPMMDEDCGAPGSGGNMGVMSAMTQTMAALRGIGRPMAQPA